MGQASAKDVKALSVASTVELPTHRPQHSVGMGGLSDAPVNKHLHRPHPHITPTSLLQPPYTLTSPSQHTTTLTSPSHHPHITIATTLTHSHHPHTPHNHPTFSHHPHNYSTPSHHPHNHPTPSHAHLTDQGLAMKCLTFCLPGNLNLALLKASMQDASCWGLERMDMIG